MEKLLAFLNSLTPAEQAAFAGRCHTTVGYLRKAISVRQALREALCIDIERESNRAVLCDDLRTDVDWSFLRGSADQVRAIQEREANEPRQQPLGFAASSLLPRPVGAP